jgi:hypothetical protein
MEPEKKEFKQFVKSVQQHLEEGTIYNESFKQELLEAKKKTGIETKQDGSYPEPQPGHVLQ